MAGESARGIDAARLRSLIGLSLGFIGPRAYLSVSGVLLTLLVASRATSATAITFALYAGGLVSLVLLPITGRASDRTVSRIGRRTPYMGVSLVAMGLCTYSLAVLPGYWSLVAMIVICQQGIAVLGLTSLPAFAESFGASRWIRAAGASALFGTLLSLSIKGLVISTWKLDRPTTWLPPFKLAGLAMMISGVAVLALVREHPSSTAAPRNPSVGSIGDQLRQVLSRRNNRVLASGVLVFVAGTGSTSYLAIVYFLRVLHAGASAQMVAAIATAVGAIVAGILIGPLVARLLTRRHVGILAPLGGAVTSGGVFFAHHLWQAVVLGIAGGPLIGAFLIATGAYLGQLLPPSGGMGERLGIFAGPFAAATMLVAFAAAGVVDATGDYRVIWLFPAGAGLLQAVIMLGFHPVAGDERPRLGAFYHRVRGAVASGRGRTRAALLGGEVAVHEADSSTVLDALLEAIGNPYASGYPASVASSRSAGGSDPRLDPEAVDPDQGLNPEASGRSL